MKNILKKSIAVVLCMAFSGMQMSFATVLTRGVDSFNNAQVLGGTGAVIRNASSGLKQVETDQTNATLRFDNHTKIDWSKFNVDNGQKLYFNNGSYGVLNVVTQGSISKIAGTIQADSGRIIISNPNGILFNGGSFLSTGSLLLTTKNLESVADDINYNTYNIGTATNAVSGSAPGIVAVIGSSSISSPDISILANGVHFDAADLASPSTNGVVLVTADGANYAATTLAGTSVTTKAQPLYIANSSIQTKDGTITLATGGSAKIIDSTLEGDLTAKGAKVANKAFSLNNTVVDGNAEIKDADYIQVLGGSHIKGNLTTRDNKDNTKDTYGTYVEFSTIDGNLEVHGVDNVRIKSATAGKTTVDADGGYIQVNGSTLGVAGESNSLDAHGSYVAIYKGTTFNGDTDVKGSEISFGYYETDGTIVQDTTTINGNLTAIIDGTIGFSDIVKANNITFVTNKSSILNAHSANGNGTLIAMDAAGNRGDITLTATKGAITSISGDQDSSGISPYFYYMFDDGAIYVPKSGTVEGYTYTDMAQLAQYKTNTNVDLFGRNAELISTGRNSVRADLTGNLSITTDAVAYVEGSVGGNATVTAGTTAQLSNATVNGNADVSADMIQVLNGTRIKGNATLKDVKDNAKDSYGIYVTDSKIDGNLVAKGKTAESPDNVRILNSTVDGTVTADANGNIQLLGSTVGKTTLTNANQQNYVRVDNSTINGNLDITQADSIIFGTYGTDSILSAGTVTVNGDLNANAIYTIGYSSDITANTMAFTTTDSSVVQANTDTISGSLTANSITVNAPVGAVVGLSGSADSGVSEFYTAMQGSYIPGTKGAADHNAVTMKSLNNGADDLTVNLNTKVSNLDTTAANTKVNVTSAGGKLQDLKITASNNVDAQNIQAVKAAADTANTSGNVVVTSTNGNVKIGNVVGDTDVKVYAENGNIEVTGKLVADNEDNGVGELNLTGKKAYNSGATDLLLNSSNAGGANIIVNIESGNVTATGLTTDRHSAGNTSGNFIISTNGDVSVGNVIADTDLKVNAGNGNISVTGNLKADNEGNGVGELFLKGNTAVNAGATDLTLTALNAGGASVIVDIESGDINASGITTHRDTTTTDNTYGNFKLITDNGNIKVGDITADTDLIVQASNKVTVTGSLLADNESNGIGDLIIKGATAVNGGTDSLSLNGNTGANIEVVIDKGDITATGLKAAGNDDNNGNITIKTGEGNVNVAGTNATHDITITASKGTDATKGYATVTNTKADSEPNGRGDLTINADNEIVATNVTGGNITATTTNGDVTLSGATATRAADDSANTTGNVTVTTPNGSIVIEDVTADTNIVATALAGTIAAEDLFADAESNGVGDVILQAGNGLTLDDVDGANITATTTVGDVIAQGLDAVGLDDNNGNITISTGKGDVTVDNTNGTHDITITANKGGDDTKGHATVTNTKADSEENGKGTLTIIADDKVIATNDGGANVIITSNDSDIEATNINTTAPNDNNNGDIIITANNGDVTVNGAHGDHDVIITAGGDADVTNAHADKDNNKAGDLIINAGGKADVDNGSGNNVEIKADDDITAKDINGKDDVVIISDNGGVTGENLIADGDGDSIGDLTIKGNGDVSVTGGEGASVEIESQNGDVTAEDIVADGNDNNGGAGGKGDVIITANNGDVTVDGVNGTHDVVITAGGDADVTDAHADTDDNKHGDLIINAGGKADVEDGTGNNVDIHADDDINVKDIEGKDDVTIISDNGGVTGENLVADGDNDGIGELIVSGYPVIIDNVVIIGGGGNPSIDNSLGQEVTKNLNNLLQSGVDSQLAQSFTPIAFAAEDDDEQSAIAKRIAKTVFKTPETGIVTITEKYKSVK